jgi:flagellin
MDQAASTDPDAAQGDRQKVQDEINSLVKEIDSMTERVQFNGKTLLNGDYGDGKTTDLPDIQETYGPKGTPQAPGAATAGIMAEMEAMDGFSGITDETKTWTDADGTGGANSDISAKQTALDDAFTAVKDAGENVTEADVDALISALEDFDTAADTAGYAAIATEQGDAALTQDNVDALKSKALEMKEAFADKTAVPTTLDDAIAADGSITADKTSTTSTADFEATIGGGGKLDDLIATDKTVSDAVDAYKTALAGDDNDAIKEAFSNIKEAFDSFGGGGTEYDDWLADADGKAAMQAGADKMAANDAAATEPKGKDLYFQIGANANQSVSVNINSVSAKSLGLADENGNVTINVMQESGKDITGLLDGIDKALTRVTTERSKLGAVSNRLDYSIKSLDVSSENLSAAESRIRDTDMAKEMMNLTKSNVLQQASISMLAQANQAPQSLLSLLQ